FLSINITTPYKPVAYACAEVRASTARLSHGVNLLAVKKDTLLGYNTDGAGCIYFLEDEGFDFHGKSVVVCGTGPTSIAILHYEAIAGADDLVMLSRDKNRAKKVLTRYVDDYRFLKRRAIDLGAESENHRSFTEAYEKPKTRFGAYETSRQTIHDADLIVDATSLGMHEGDPAPFDTELLREGQWVLDTVYGHGETSLAKGAKEAGAKFFDGSGMLVGQALISAQIVCEINEIDLSIKADEIYKIMYKAAFGE
ncbi:MAG: shikimate dehydrogenase, partial [Eggerthellaceae bacterium]|nr:shikimate dehydrogenase [Eggerthellaceae bacterium]